MFCKIIDQKDKEQQVLQEPIKMGEYKGILKNLGK